jgi:ABC-type phosphate transport system substrate-binding protein
MLHKQHNSVITLAVLLSLVGLSEPAKAFLITQSDPSPKSFAVPDQLPQDTKIQIAASNSTNSINQSLKEGFIAKYPNAKVNITTQASGNDLKPLSEGQADLVAIGRPLTAAEKSQGFKAVPISREKIAIIVSNNNPYNGNLTISQFAQIFKGEITDWSELGGSPGSIKLVDFPNTNDTRQAFPSYPVFQTGEFTTGSNAVKLKEDSIQQMIAQLGNNGIGYAVANDVVNRDDVKVLTMHQTQPDDQRYPFSQPFSLIYKGTPSEAAQAFLGFATTQGGQQAIAKLVGSLSNTDAAAISSSFSNQLKKASSTPQVDNNDNNNAGANSNTNANGNGTIAGADGKTTANGNGTTAGIDGKTTANGNGTIAGADGKTTANGNGTIAGTGLEGSGEINPNVEGSGEVNPNLKDSGQVNPNVDGSGEVNPNLKDSGQVNPNVDGSGEVNPNLNDSGEPNSAAKLETNAGANSEATPTDDNNTAANSSNGNDQNIATTAKKGSWWWWLPLLLLPLGALALYLFGRGRKSDQEPAISNIPNPDDPQGGGNVPLAPHPDNLAASGANSTGNIGNVATNTVGNNSKLGGAAIVAGGAAAANLLDGRQSTEADTDIDLELDQTETEINDPVVEIPSNPVEEFSSQSTKLQGTDQSTKLQSDLDFTDDVDSPDAGLLDNVVPLAGAGITGAAAANLLDEQQSTVAELDFNLELDETETELDNSVVETDANPVEEFTTQSTELQGTEQSTKLQTDLDYNDDVDHPDAELLDNVVTLAGAGITGAAAANLLDERQNTAPELDFNLELDETETEVDNSVVETDVNPDGEFTTQSTKLQGTEQSTKLQTDLTDLNFNDDLDNFDVGLANNTTLVEEAGREVSSLFTPDNQSTIETTEEVTEENPNLEATEIKGNTFAANRVDIPEANPSESDTNWVDRLTQSGAAIAGGAAVSGFFNRENNQSSIETTDEVTEENPNLETTEIEGNTFSLDSVDTPEMDLSLDNFVVETDANPDGEFTSQSTKLQGTEQSTKLQTDLTDLNFNDDLDNFDVGLVDNLTSVEETGREVSSLFTEQDNQSTIEPQIIEGELDNSRLGTTNNNFADNVVADDRNSNLDDITFDESDDSINASLQEITFDETNSEDVSLDDITFDESDDSINASLQEITFDETDSEDVSLDDITFDDDNSANDNLEEITFDENESNTINDLINSLDTSYDNQEINSDNLSFKESTENSADNLLSKNTAEIVDFETDSSSDINNISTWLESLETSNQNTEDISEWLDKLNTADYNSIQEDSNNDVNIIESKEETEEISFQFLEDLLERDINGNKENK